MTAADFDWEEFWWTGITGPRNLVSQAVESLLGGDSLALRLPEDLPWPRQMREAVELGLKRSSLSGAVLHRVDAQTAQEAGPGRYLLQRFAQGAVRNEYRERSGLSIQDYLVNNKVLRNSVVWVTGLEGETARRWLNFCCDYAAGSAEDGLFILELPADVAVPNRKRLRLLDFQDCAGSYDLQLFNSLILDEGPGYAGGPEYSENWKKYIAAMAALLCGTDAEVSQELILSSDFTREEPVDALRRVAGMPEFDSRGGQALSLCRSGSFWELERKVWTAQIQVLFPIIEMERMNIVERFYQDIQGALEEMADEGIPMKQYEREVESPQDLDIGGLYYLIHCRRPDMNYALYMPDEEVRERIGFLRECRNHLAHASCCSAYEVNRLLGGAGEN